MMAEVPPVLDANEPYSPLSVAGDKTALLLMDFHSWLVGSMPPEGRKALETARSLREWARTKNIFIVHCLIDFKTTIPQQFKIGSTAARVIDQMNKGGPEAPAEAPELAAASDEYVFKRPLGCISGLSSYGLEDFIKHYDIQSLIISGVATSGCVIDTAKAATEKGRIVTVVEDACADRKVETHEFIVKKLLGRQCHVVNMESLTAAWK